MNFSNHNFKFDEKTKINDAKAETNERIRKTIWHLKLFI